MSGSKDGISDLSAQEVRLLRLLAKAPDKTLKLRAEADNLIISGRSHTHSFKSEVIQRMTRLAYVFIAEDQIGLTTQGRLSLKAALRARAGEGLARNNSVELVEQVIDGEQKLAHVNIDESPLSRLYKRRKHDGTGYISDQEFLAGERIRADFRRANLEPKISANWSMTAGSAGKGGKSSASDISDIAIDARTRFHRSLECIGPDLAGVVVDVCCFLKGLETVERERRWPPRSAKLMLKTALAALARHYGLVHEDKRESGKLMSWGAVDFKPAI